MSTTRHCLVGLQASQLELGSFAGFVGNGAKFAWIQVLLAQALSKAGEPEVLETVRLLSECHLSQEAQPAW